MKKLASYLLLLAAMGLGFAFASCKADDDDDTTYYTVSFNSDGGTEVKSQKVESGKKATKPADPTKQAIATETYAFENWYTSTDNGTTLSDTAFDFNTPITKDITLYAKWATNVVTHTVTFDSKNGSTAEIKTVNHGNKVERPTNPTKAATEAETYTFDNWYTSTDGGTTLSESAFDFDTAIEGDITLYAKWTATAIHTVTFNTKGGSTSPAKQTIEHGKKATKPETDPTKTETETEAFVFAGWYTSTDGGTTLSETAFDFNTAITDNITLYAKYDVYTIEYIELKNCSVIRTMFETLCDYDSSSYPYKFKKTITRFAKADARPEAAENYIDAAGNQIPLWYDEGKTTLYYYLEPGKKMTLRTSDNNSLFQDMSDAVYIETGDFDTSKVTSMYCMFYGCKALTSLDVSKFDTSKVTDMTYMFFGCSSLTTIFASDKFVTDAVTLSPLMFTDCTKLKGGAGTVYDASHTDKEYARIDGGTENPGYFTAKTN